jgi:2-hydroxy-3-keto-5-methylthiopentenyl-1-phosphate phosphatase
MKTREHIAVLSDFDGTITIGGVMDLIYTKFAEPSCWELVQKWIRGEITTPQEIQGCFSSMKATREEMESILDTVQIDPSFPEFVQFCQKQKYLLAILSDGLKWYINYILNRFRIDGLQIYANEINFLPDGYQITTPYFDPITPKRGVSKPRIIEKFKSDGYKVIFIGDGLSDIEAVHVADVIYARDELLNYCVQKNVPATGFSDMRELISKWKTD